ncbi:MAG: GDSL-type esterase/lipase family protein, partial [Planctomycetota bacterium]
AATYSCTTHWRVIARSGYTAQKVYEKLLPKVQSTQLDLIVIGLGGNDTFKLTPPNKWKRDIQRLILELRKRFPKTPIIFSNVPPIRSFPAFTKLSSPRFAGYSPWPFRGQTSFSQHHLA